MDILPFMCSALNTRPRDSVKAVSSPLSSVKARLGHEPLNDMHRTKYLMLQGNIFPVR